MDNQKWCIEPVGEQHYKIKSKLTGEYITVNGNKIQLSENNASTNQMFKFSEIAKRDGIDVSTYQRFD